MEDFSALTAGERALLEALNRHQVRFLLVGLSAAVLQGANSATRDIDLWFANTDPRLREAIREAKGVWVSAALLRVLSIDRIIASKRASGRPNDLAALPALEEALAAAKHG
jgi:hypothetical protein